MAARMGLGGGYYGGEGDTRQLGSKEITSFQLICRSTYTSLTIQARH